MNKWLHNPWVVGSMALMALMVVYVQIVAPIMHKPSMEHPLSADQGAPLIDIPHATARHSLTWSTAANLRNPFLHRAAYAQAAIGQAADAAVADTSAERQNPYQLSAILLGGTQPLAWVGGKLVGLGDRVEAMKVIKIKADVVVLQGKQSKRTLTLTQQAGGYSHE